MHVEAVTSIVNRAEPLCTLLVLLASSAYDHMLLARTPSFWAIGLRSMSVFFFVTLIAAAVLSKETGITAIFIFATRDLLHFWSQSTGVEAFWRKSTTMLVLRMMLSVTVAFGYLTARSEAMGGGALIVFPPGQPLWAVSSDALLFAQRMHFEMAALRI